MTQREYRTTVEEWMQEEYQAPIPTIIPADENLNREGTRGFDPYATAHLTQQVTNKVKDSSQ